MGSLFLEQDLIRFRLAPDPITDDGKTLLAEAAHPGNPSTWLPAELITPVFLHSFLQSQVETLAEPDSQYLYDLINQHASISLGWTKPPKSNSLERADSQPRVSLLPRIRGGGNHISALRPRIELPPNPGQSAGNLQPEVKEKTNEKTKVHNQDQNTLNQNKDSEKKAATKKTETPMDSIVLDDSVLPQEPKNLLEIAYLIRFGKSSNSMYHALPMIKMVSLWQSVTSRHIFELGLLAESQDRRICTQLWRLLGEKYKNKRSAATVEAYKYSRMFQDPHYLRVLAQCILFIDISPLDKFLKEVVDYNIKHLIKEVCEGTDWDWNKIDFMNAFGLLLDSLVMRNMNIIDKETSEDISTKLTKSSLSLTPELTPIFEKVSQGLIRISGQSSFQIEYRKKTDALPEGKEDGSFTESENSTKDDAYDPAYIKARRRFIKAKDREIWYDNYIYFKCLIISHRIKDAQVFSDYIFKTDKTSEFAWFVVSDFIEIAELPIKECSKSAFSYVEKMTTNSFLQKQRRPYGFHVIQHLKKFITVELHSRKVKNILQRNSEKGDQTEALEPRNLFLSLAEQEFGVSLEKIYMVDSKTKEFSLPIDVFDAWKREHRKKIESQGSSTHISSRGANISVEHEAEEEDDIYVRIKADRGINDDSGDHAENESSKKAGSRGASSKDQKTNDAETIIDDFLRDKPGVMVILGKSGSGKSTFARKEAERLKKSFDQQGDTYLGFINLTVVEKPSNIEEYVRKMASSDFNSIYGKDKGVLIMDGYDELKDSGKLRIIKENIAFFRRFHVIITYRYNLQETRSDLEKLFGTDDETAKEYATQYMVLKPFGNEEIGDYVRQYVGSYPEIIFSADTILSRISSSPNLKESSQSPFILSLIMRVLPKYMSEKKAGDSTTLSRFDIYDGFVEIWHKNSSENSKNPEVFDKKKFDKFSLLFAKELIKDDGVLYALVQKSEKGGKWESFFGNTFELSEIRKGVLVRKFQSSGTEDKYGFVHRSIQEFFVAKVVIDEVENSTWQHHGSVLPRLKEKDHVVKLFLADYAFKHLRFRDKLLEIIKASKSVIEGSVASSASTAITILNYARIPFHHEDFSNIHIPNADLSQSVFQFVDFSGANLKSVSFKDADLRGCKFDGANLEKTEFSQLPKLVHEDVVNCATVDATDDIVQFYTASSTKIFAWDLDTCETMINMSHHGIVSAVSLAKKGEDNIVISGDRSGSIYIWDAVLCEKKQVIPAEILQGGQIMEIQSSQKLQKMFGLDDKPEILFISCSMDGTISFFLYDPKKQYKSPREIIIKQIKWAGTINSIDFFMKEEKKYIVFGGAIPNIEYHEMQLDYKENTISLGDPLLLESGNKQVKVIRVIKYQDRYKIAAAIDKEIFIYDSEDLNKNVIKLPEEHKKTIRDIQWVPSDDGDSEYLISSGADRMVYMWNISEGSIMKPFYGHAKEIAHMSIFKYESEYYLLGCCQDKSAWIWGITSRELVKKASGHQKAINSFSLLVDPPLNANDKSNESGHINNILCSSGMIVTGSSDEKIKLWDYATGNCVATVLVKGLVRCLIAKRIKSDLVVYYQLAKELDKIYAMLPFDKKENDSVILKTKDKIRHFNFFTDGADFMFYATNKGLYMIKLSSITAEEIDGHHKTLIDSSVNTFSFKKIDSDAIILVTCENGTVYCRTLKKNEQDYLEVDDDKTIDVESESGIESPGEPIFTKENVPDSQSVIIGDESGLLYRFDFNLETNQADQQVLFEVESPIYTYDTMVFNKREFVAFGSRDGFVRIMDSRNPGDGVVFEQQIHNQVRAIKYLVDYNTLITTGENGFIYVWIPRIDPDNENRFNLLLVWTSHTTLVGNQLTHESLRMCSQPNKFLMAQLTKPPILEN